MPSISGETESTRTEALRSADREPFRGLRYFDEADAHLFFGRDEQVDDVLERLRRSSFVAVMGSSGSGKSSLVRAGLIPALRAGLLVQAGGRWRVIITQPADTPIATMAERLASAFAQESSEDIEVSLRRGPLGLREVFEQLQAGGTRSNTLLVVDQFEEIFRFQREAARADASLAAEEAAAYVKLLLAVTSADCPVYVVLTMRSDFLGNCAQFRDLPERINDGIYLVPRMARDQLRAAVVGPVAVVGGEIEPALVEQVLNDVGEDPDQLPTLQHALLMTWRQNPGHLRLVDYAGAGTLKEALSRDANRVFDGLSRPQQRIARILFQRLSERDADSREVRRRCTVDEVALVAGAPPAAVSEVIDAFCKADLLLQIGDLVDVIHESLLRKWDRLQGGTGAKGWLDEEAEARDIFLELDRRERGRAGSADVLRGADLPRARQWARRRRRPAWGTRYIPDGDRFRRIRNYIAQSVVTFRTERQERGRRAARRFRAIVATAAVSLLIAVIMGILAFYLWRMRNDAEDGAIVAAASGMVDRDPTKALLLLSEVTSPTAISNLGGLQAALRAASAIHSTQTFRHDAPVKLAAFSPDGSRVATVTAGGHVSLWSTGTAGGPQVLAGRGQPISEIDFSRDGLRLVAGLADGTASVWNLDTPGPARVLEGHRGPVTSASFEPSPRGRVLTSSTDGTVRLWNEEAGFTDLPAPSPDVPESGLSDALLTLLRVLPPVHIARFSPDGRFVAAGRNDGNILIWRSDSIGSPLLIGAHVGPVRIVAFSPDSNSLLTASDDGLAKLWSLDGEPRQLDEYRHPGPVTAAAFDPTGVRILTASSDGTIRVSYTTRKPTLELTGQKQAIVAARFSPDGRRLLAFSLDRTIRVWNVDGEQQRVIVRPQEGSLGSADDVSRVDAALPLTLRGHDAAVWSAVFDARGERVLTASDDRTARIWDLGAESTTTLGTDGVPLVNAVFGPGRSIVTIASDGISHAWLSKQDVRLSSQSRPMAPTASAAAPSGTMVALGFADGRVEVRRPGEAAKPAVMLAGRSAAVQAIAFNSAERTVATGSSDGTAQIWRLDEPGHPVDLPGHSGPVSAVAFSPDGTRVATGSDDATVRMWRVDGQPLRTLGPHPGPVRTLAFSPNGQVVVSGAGDGKARVWTLDSDEDPIVVTHGSPITHVAFSPDGRRILTVSRDRDAKVWSGGSWQNQVSIGSEGGSIVHASFAPLGREFIVTASSDGVARVWRQDGSGDPLELRGHSKPIIAARFSADGTRVLTASEDGTARLWTVDFGELLSLVRQRVKTCLSAEDRIRFLGESLRNARSASEACEERRGIRR